MLRTSQEASSASSVRSLQALMGGPPSGEAACSGETPARDRQGQQPPRPRRLPRPGIPSRQAQLATPPPEAEKVFTAPGMLGSKQHWAVPLGRTWQVSP